MPVRTRVVRIWSAIWGRGCQWVVLDVSKRSLGLVGLTPHKEGSDWEVSYQFMPGAWGNGYATEAIAYLLDHAPVTRVIAETQVANGASCRLLERIGFVEEIRLVRFGAEQIIYARET